MSPVKRPVLPRALLTGLALCLCSLGCSAQMIEAVTEETSYSFLVDGKVGGVASVVAERMLQLAGLTDYHFSLYPWARAYDMALLQPNVLIYPMVRTPSRESQFKWVGEIARLTPRFYKLRAERSIVVKRLDDARQYTIGVIRDDVRHEYLQSHDFSRLVISPNNTENLRKLLHRQVQLVAMPEREARQQCEDAHIPYETLETVFVLDDLASGVYYAYSLGTPDAVVARTRVAFEQIRAAGGLLEIEGRHP